MKRIVKKILKTISFIVIICGPFVLLLCFVEPEPLVIFAGGGSVKNYIKKHDLLDLENKKLFPNHVYINLPSGYIETLLREEIVNFAKRYENKEPEKSYSISLYIGNRRILPLNLTPLHSYLYVGLSAMKIREENLKLNETQKKYVQIYEDSIGEDPLVVFAKREIDSLTIDSLKELLRNSTTIYATFERSGTHFAYKELLGLCEKESTYFLDSLKLEPYYEDMNVIDSDGCIILGSDCYPDTCYIDTTKYKKNYVYKDKLSVQKATKPLYLYFVGYKNRDVFKPNKQVIDFLNKVHKNKKIEDDVWEKSNDSKVIKSVP